jgi:hypothetical protein
MRQGLLTRKASEAAVNAFFRATTPAPRIATAPRVPHEILTTIKGKTLDGILFDGTLQHAAQIGAFLVAGFAIEQSKGVTRIKLNEGNTEILEGDFLVLNGQPLRVISKADLDLMWEIPPKAPKVTTWWDWLKNQVKR